MTKKRKDRKSCQNGPRSLQVFLLHLKEKCRNCEHLERCRIGRNSLTTKEIVIYCEGFYYIFRKMEEFEQRPMFDGNVEKYREETFAYEKKHEGVPLLTSPLIVNGALAAELALKFLMQKKIISEK